MIIVIFEILPIKIAHQINQGNRFCAYKRHKYKISMETMITLAVFKSQKIKV